MLLSSDHICTRSDEEGSTPKHRPTTVVNSIAITPPITNLKAEAEGDVFETHPAAAPKVRRVTTTTAQTPTYLHRSGSRIARVGKMAPPMKHACVWNPLLLILQMFSAVLYAYVFYACAPKPRAQPFRSLDVRLRARVRFLVPKPTFAFLLTAHVAGGLRFWWHRMHSPHVYSVVLQLQGSNFCAVLKQMLSNDMWGRRLYLAQPCLPPGLPTRQGLFKQIALRAPI
jgi:hypothetical protein